LTYMASKDINFPTPFLPLLLLFFSDSGITRGSSCVTVFSEKQRSH
jgi:hypothetical protein